CTSLFIMVFVTIKRYECSTQSMSKKLLFINGSPRTEGVDAVIGQMIAETVKKYNYETEFVNVCKLNIHGCRACETCKQTGACVQKDDMAQMYEKIKSSDMIVIASPIYFAAETGQIKCFMDRFYAMVKNVNDQRSIDFGNVKKGSVILTCGNPDGEMSYGGVLTRITGTLKFLGISDLSGAIIGGLEPNAVRGSLSVKKYIESIEFQLGM
ncbi:MAG: flavodoxin family protein, partial [archaeon]|nr:flavodoxin family protein [archaeon]